MKNIPEQEQIDHWLQTSIERINRKHQLLKEDFYKKENIPIQSHYVGLAGWHASLARAKFLNGDPIDEVRAEFATASRHILKSFTMAYDETDSDYVGGNVPLPGSASAGYDQLDWSCVMETIFIDGANYALMAADFQLAAELGRWFRDRGNGKKMDIEVNHYSHGLARAVQGHSDNAKALIKAQLERYEKKPAKGHNYRTNYYTLDTALYGILDRDEARFNEGLKLQLMFYQGYARGEGKNTTFEFICDHSVALANLGIHQGLPVTVEHDTLPKGLLIQE